MTLEGTRFGTIDYTPDDVVIFNEGLIGFGSYSEYVMIVTKEGSPYRWLQCLEEPKLAFLVCDPNSFLDDYSPEISQSQANALKLEHETAHLVLVTTTIPAGRPQEARANLAAPIIINLETNHAKQVVLDDDAYTIRYPIFSGAKTQEPVAA
jgi:flagellar assembly factor FliW